MDAKILLDNLATVAEGPGGADRLRALVLGLALRGQLVPQDPNDEPSSELLERVRLARLEVIRSNGWKAPAAATPVSELDHPSSRPPGWSWTRLENLALPQAGFAFKSDRFNSSGTGMPLIRIRDIGNDTTECYYDGDFRPEFVVNPGDYLIGMDGNFNIRRWRGAQALLNQRVTRLIFFDEDVQCSFVTWALQERINALNGSRAYTTVQHLSGKQIGASIIPVPPSGEQARIVAKVDELMGLCDQLEARQERRRHANTRFRASALRALTEAETPEDSAAAWQRISSNLHAVVDTGSAIDELRRAIVQLAVQGQLVSQEDDDEPADEILAVADRQKQKLLLDGVAQRRSALEPIRPDEFQRELPRGWALERLDRWCDVAGGVAKGRSLVGRDVCTLPYLRVANVKAGFLVLDEVKTIDVGVDEVARYSLQAGDVLLTEGGDWDKLGRSAVWNGEIDPCLHQNHVFRARRLTDQLLPWWVSLYTNSAAGRTYFQSKAKRTTNLASINMTELRSMPLPVPPFAEQRRIAKRVADLMSLCGQLEARLGDRMRAQSAVAISLARVG